MEPGQFIEALRKSDRYIEIIYLNGSCYQFYKLLKTLYPESLPYINKEHLHVITKIGDSFYDIRGKVSGKSFYPLTDIKEIEIVEKWSFYKNNWLGRACPECGELIPGN